VTQAFTGTYIQQNAWLSVCTTSEVAMLNTGFWHMTVSQCAIKITLGRGDPSKWNLTTISGNKAPEQNPYVRKIWSTLRQNSDAHNKTISEMTAKRISRDRKRAAWNKRKNYLVLCIRYKQSFRNYNEATPTKLNNKINLHMTAVRNVCVSCSVQNLNTKTGRTSEQYIKSSSITNKIIIKEARR
jgi:hypothetical protein